MATIQPQITPSAANWDIGRKMFDILEDLLNPSTALSPSEAAQRIKSLHHEYHSPVTDTGRFLFEFWDLLFKIAAQLPHDGQQQRILINFIDDLRKIHTEHEHEGHKLWGDLPDHGMYGWEAFNGMFPAHTYANVKLLMRNRHSRRHTRRNEFHSVFGPFD